MTGRRFRHRHRPEWVQQLEPRRLLANLGELGIYLVDHASGLRVDDPSAGQHVEIRASFLAEQVPAGTIVRIQRQTANGVLYTEIAAPPSWAEHQRVERNLFTWTVPPVNAWVTVTLDPRDLLAEDSEEDNDQTLTLTPHTNSPNPEVPVFHSLPAARFALYLDFDGNYQERFAGSQDITTPAYDTDGNPALLSALERDEIRQIWARVAEDYAPFAINVTTEEPSVGQYERYQRVAIGGASCDWYEFSAAGTALLGSFHAMNAASAAFVFTEQANGDGSSSRFPLSTIADAVSHESGHAFGLWHQAHYDNNGTLLSDYHPGSGPWGPIMGRSGNPISTWHHGPTHESATSYQDDMAVLADERNGFGTRADDFGNDAANASHLGTFAGNGAVLEASGVIQTSDDTDVFAATLPAGIYRFAANVATDGPNLDAVLELRDANGGLLAVSDPPDSQSAAIEMAVPAGTYHLLVRSTGAYGRVGQYWLAIGEPAAQAPPAPLPTPQPADGPAPDLAAKLTAPPPKSVITGTKAATAIAVTNVGDVDQRGPITVKVYASQHRRLATGGVLLGKHIMRNRVGSGEQKHIRVPIAYPTSMSAGNYFIVATVEGKGPERLAGNNVATSAAKVKVIATAPRLTGAVIPPQATLSRRPWQATVALGNTGNALFSGKAIVKLYASKDGVFGNEDDVLIGKATLSATVRAGTARNLALRAKAAGKPGAYHIFAAVTTQDGVTEAARKAVKVRFA